MRRTAAYLAALMLATATFADAPETSLRPEVRISTSNAPSFDRAPLRPVLRPDLTTASAPLIARPSAEVRPVVRPFLRPPNQPVVETRAINRAEQDLFAFSPFAVANSLLPEPRPASLVRRYEERRAARLRGQVCGDPSIQGVTVGRVEGRGRCGIESAVRIKSVSGVRLSTQAVLDCPTAQALNRWVRTGARPAVGDLGGGISSLRVVSHYSCRFRNSASSGRLSEHSFGHAIDIAGIGLQNGDEITLLTDWGSGAKGRALRQMWRAACGPFGTVLGPESNRFHRDHFHFDTARYRSGSYCR